MNTMFVDFLDYQHIVLFFFCIIFIWLLTLINVCVSDLKPGKQLLILN